ncbi:hypothetical protein SAMN06265219_105163 [Gracilimonas mengyeensis]|uniref:Type IX secretion system protein PorQ n=1 Tax=Gracilimonas mengyeensis TaxID=1302730 RepID=A0A521CHG3_9BACT|nr:hypothetical protein SAMN06265219_105163 [Gracilimonas mengyeensis]
MVKNVRLILTLLLTIAAVQGTAAQSNTSSIFRFLEITPNARASALGGNHAGLYQAQSNMMHVNPAYLNTQSSGYVSASYINFLGDANMGFTSAAYTVDGIGTFGAGIRYVGYGEFNEFDENGTQLGSFSANDMALTGAYSRAITPKLTAGAGVDLIYSSYASFNSSAFGISGGVFYQDTTSHFSAGISVRNLGSQISTYDGRYEPLPLDISVGITKKPEAFPFQLSLTLKRLNDWDMRVFGETDQPDLFNNVMRHVLFGGEANLGQNLHLRLGYDHYLHEQTDSGGNFSLAGVSFGIGFTVKSIDIDLSRNSYSKLGGITRLSIKTKLF